MVAAKVQPGEYYVTTSDEVIITVLGSCISACIRDADLGIGGINHFMLPGGSSGSEKWGGEPVMQTRFGYAAMETLVNDILKLGGRKNRLEVKLFGGGRVLDMEINNVGARNIAFAKQFVAEEGLNVLSEDFGDVFPRKVIYFPKTGRAMVKRLRSLERRIVADREQAYDSDIRKTPKTGDIELFT